MVTNQQIFTELQEVKSSIRTLETNQKEQGNKILEILLKDARKEGKEEAEGVIIDRRKNDKAIFWTAVAALATAAGAIVAVMALVMTLPKVV